MMDLLAAITTDIRLYNTQKRTINLEISIFRNSFSPNMASKKESYYFHANCANFAMLPRSEECFYNLNPETEVYPFENPKFCVPILFGELIAVPVGFR